MNRPLPWFAQQPVERSHEERLMTWAQPTWVERNGELIAAALGLLAIGVAAGFVVAGVIGSVLS